MPCIIYTDIESLSKKVDGCSNNLENYSTTKRGEQIPFGYSVSIIWTFNYIENKLNWSHGKDCMKKLCYLREYTNNIIDFEKKKMLLLTKEELKSHVNAKVCYICGKRNLKKAL